MSSFQNQYGGPNYYLQMQNQANEYINCKRQLAYIIMNFKGIHAEDKDAMQKLVEAETVLSTNMPNDVHSCANLVQVRLAEQAIMDQHSTNKPVSEKHQKVIEEAKALNAPSMFEMVGPGMMFPSTQYMGGVGMF